MVLCLPAVSPIQASSPQEPASALSSPPFEVRDPEIRARWERGWRLEQQRDFQASNRDFEEITTLAPEISHVYWRIARNHLRATQQLPMADEAGRREGFAQVLRWAERGSARDPGCAECTLYEFIGLASLTRMEGTVRSARSARRMKELIERTLELGPTHTDGDWNHELANAYFAAGIFYKVVPDSRLAKWLLGARGDRERSLEYYRKAFELRSNRVEFRLTLGLALVCQGQQGGEEAQIEEGLSLLRSVASLDDHLATDPIYRDHAARLAADPGRACDYSGEEWRRAEGR